MTAISSDTSNRRIFGISAILGSLVFVAFMEAVTLRYLVLTYSPVTFWDSWDNITPHQLFSKFFEHHNEHRIAIPKLFYLVDTYLNAGRQTLLIAATHVTIVVNGFLFGYIASRLFRVPLLQQVALSLLFCGLFLSLQQRNILEWGFMICWPLVYLFVICAYVVLIEKRGNRPLLVSFLLGLCAALSLANGALTFVPIAVLAAFSRNIRLLGFSIVATAALLALHYWGLKPSPLPEFQGGPFQYAIELVKYSLVYVGTPIALVLNFLFVSGPDPLRMGGPGVDPWLPLVCGFVAVATFSALALRVMVHRQDDRASLILVAIGGFVLVSALATAMGRAGLGLATATDGRYGMGATFFLAATALLLAHFLWNRMAVGRVIVALFVGVLVITTAFQQVHIARRDREWANLRKMPAAALLSGVDDQYVMGLAFPWQDQFPALVSAVRADRLGVFSDPWTDWLDKPLTLPIVQGCQGHMDGSDPITSAPGALRLNGWANTPGHLIGTQRLVITDATGNVVGYGFSGWARLDVPAALPNIKSNYTGWYGYARADHKPPLKAYVLFGEGACALSG
ncbi:hypothetical protein SAMN04515648_4570 [Phyllobacterium sp. CL33Tsu]|uniref:hypothetical protein n=1 Tax=Phyllobacterium sp. CL33Tsu TaxID=1798191 RepID=UPI0008EEF0BC|nr:hypothetical protein [Phyllobacterium sp. CL33Tsu]SFJ55277.1 hypothetical protein SAMN04515648_4570 [Phyllobacterium sp. CL33Tsu]